jgi:hypothetical protein
MKEFALSHEASENWLFHSFLDNSIEAGDSIISKGDIVS